MQLIHRPAVDAEFRRTEIPDRGLVLRRTAPAGLTLANPSGAHADTAALVLPFVENDVRHAALVVAPGVRGLHLGGRRPLDVVVLAERDEIVLGASRLYFTARRPLAVARHEDEASCGVCGDAVRGCDAITCTHCSAVTHAGALSDGGERDCFEHRGSCPGCGLRRDDFDWMPEFTPNRTRKGTRKGTRDGDERA